MSMEVQAALTDEQMAPLLALTANSCHQAAGASHRPHACIRIFDAHVHPL